MVKMHFEYLLRGDDEVSDSFRSVLAGKVLHESENRRGVKEAGKGSPSAEYR